jgi:hypothetical protein
VIGQHFAQCISAVMIAYAQIERHSERVEHSAQKHVFLDVTEIDEIASDKHNVGPRIEAIDAFDAAAQVRRRTDAAIGELALPFDVEIADLRDEQENPSSVGACREMTSVWLSTKRVLRMIERSSTDSRHMLSPPAGYNVSSNSPSRSVKRRFSE